MTDFKTFSTSTEYAISGFYRYIYSFIPKEVRLHYNLDEAISSMREFYDPELTFENRLKYKLTSIKYFDRHRPWIALMWNNEGLQPADNHFRRYDVSISIDDKPNKAKACYVKTMMNIGIVSNSKTALDEFQEVFLLNVRPDDAAIAVEHPYLNDFVVNILDFNMTQMIKSPRSEGTLAYAVASLPLQFPIIGCVDDNVGIIQTINTVINNIKNTKITQFIVD